MSQPILISNGTSPLPLLRDNRSKTSLFAEYLQAQQAKQRTTQIKKRKATLDRLLQQMTEGNSSKRSSYEGTLASSRPAAGPIA